MMDRSKHIKAARKFPPGLEITHSTLIHADPIRIYNAITTPEGLDSWFTSGSRVNPYPGGEILFRWVNWGPDQITAEDGGPVLEAISPRRFVFEWHPDLPDYATTVEINITPSAGGEENKVNRADGCSTIVSLSEHGFADTPSGRKAMLNCAAGWGEALTLLKFYLEYGLHY